MHCFYGIGRGAKHRSASVLTLKFKKIIFQKGHFFVNLRFVTPFPASVVNVLFPCVHVFFPRHRRPVFDFLKLF